MCTWRWRKTHESFESLFKIPKRWVFLKMLKNTACARLWPGPPQNMTASDLNREPLRSAKVLKFDRWFLERWTSALFWGDFPSNWNRERLERLSVEKAPCLRTWEILQRLQQQIDTLSLLLQLPECHSWNLGEIFWSILQNVFVLAIVYNENSQGNADGNVEKLSWERNMESFCLKNSATLGWERVSREPGDSCWVNPKLFLQPACWGCFFLPTYIANPREIRTCLHAPEPKDARSREKFLYFWAILVPFPNMGLSLSKTHCSSWSHFSSNSSTIASAGLLIPQAGPSAVRRAAVSLICTSHTHRGALPRASRTRIAINYREVDKGILFSSA